MSTKLHEFRNKHTNPGTNRIIRADPKRKTRRNSAGFFKGGEFRFPANRGLFRQFFRDFYAAIFTTKHRINARLLAAISGLPLSGMDPQASSMNLVFMIYTYNNKQYYKFIKKYFDINIQTPTKKIMQLLMRQQSATTKGGSGKGTAIVPKGAIEISYKMLCITSLMCFLYFSTLFYYTQRIFTESLDKNTAVFFLRNTGDFLSKCKFSEARYKPKTKIEAMIQNLFRPLLQNPANMENFEGLMYLIKDCLSDPADDFKNKMIFDLYAKPEIVKLETIYGGPRLLSAAAEPSTKAAAAALAASDIILSTDREPIIVSPPRDAPPRTWVSREDSMSSALVSVGDSAAVRTTGFAVAEVVPTLLQKNPDYFKQLVATIKSDTKQIRDADKLIKYFDRMSTISEEDFVRMLGKDDANLFSFQGLSDMFSEMKGMKEFLGYFANGELLDKFALYQSGASVSKILYIDFKKNMRQMTNYLRRASIDTEEAFHNVIDDSVLLLEYMRTNWNNIYNILGSFLTFSIASFQIFRQYMAARRMRSRESIEDV